VEEVVGITKYQLVAKPENWGRHVVILGAGASVAAFPQGDANGRKLPTMDGLIEVLGLEPVLRMGGVKNTRRNFENIYSELYETDPGLPILKEVEDIIYAYFDALRLPEKPTLYDHLLMSLRPKDMVATFNWDPFLFDAWDRIRDSVPVPEIVHLHPLWGQLNAVYEASAGTFINSQALTLAVAIESILGSEFPDLGKPSTTECKEIDSAVKFWNTWNGTTALKERIKGAIKPLKQARAGDKMRVLAERGAITAEAAKAWQTLRNANVHAYQRPSRQLRRLLSIVQILFYQLVFCTIGYRGYYNDYSTPGWPCRKYPPSKRERATGEEIKSSE
jgi:hypothetical protein